LKDYSFSLADKIDQTAVLVCLVLLLAGWQASNQSKKVEGSVRRLWRRLWG